MKRISLSTLAAQCRELGVIPLGHEEPDYSSISDAPGCCGHNKQEQKMRMVYPELRLWSAPAETWDLPTEGTALIRYKVVAKEKRDFINAEGEPEVKHSITFEVQDMEPVKDEDEDEDEDEDKEVSFSALAARCRDLRLRDEMGTFVPSAMGAADPRLHAAAYDLPGQPKPKKKGAAGVLERMLLRKQTKRES